MSDLDLPECCRAPAPAQKSWADFHLAVPIAVIIVLIFIALQKAGLVNLIGGGTTSYLTIFVIGIVASLSSCMAVVGGLLLSMSATFAKAGSNLKPQLMFHGGRLVSFFFLGGVIGLLGSTWHLSSFGSLLTGIIIALVMLVLGLNLLDIFNWTKKLLPSMPKAVSKRALSVTALNSTLTPLLVGLVTFFLPCGFTQSIQLYALSTGSFVSGALTMLVFALGTFPVLALISFGSWRLEQGPQRSIFFKVAGLLVIAFALFNLLTALVAAGLLPPIFNL